MRETKRQTSLFGRDLQNHSQSQEQLEFDVPEEVEVLIADLMEMLGDPVSGCLGTYFSCSERLIISLQDSRVRWTCSKALARISSRLPLTHNDQLFLAILEIYPQNVLHANTSKEDLTLVSSSMWHGATLCLSSFLRSTLLSPVQVHTALPWILRSLFFSQRKGAQKVGISVRDAACYFIWCVARASSKQDNMLEQDDINIIANALVTVACTDEEVSVRRSASAAFQEMVGRVVSDTFDYEVVPS